MVQEEETQESAHQLTSFPSWGLVSQVGVQLREPLSPKSAKKLGTVRLESWLAEPGHLSGSSQDDGDMVAEGCTSTFLFQRSKGKYTVDAMDEVQR